MEYFAAALVFFFAALLQGVSGFGSGLLAVPILALWFPISVLTPALSVINIIVGGWIYWKNKEAARPSQWKWLIFSGVIASLVSGSLLLTVNEQFIKLILGFIILAVALILASGKQLPTAEHAPGHIAVGAGSGLLNGLMTLGGPPIVLFLANARIPKQQFRATLSLFFCCIAIANVANFSRQSIYAETHLYLILALLPCALIGAGIGHKLQHHVSEQRFRQLTLLLMVLSGLSVVIQSIK
ncbi:sulfite exporter TauE/SafE family protein [Idiomarina aminovorans]|uniref:sulfite exporter TauE/SafE family protein n=1 Tax=Idiomarina aminovorans TaxID=2914829 RepID=UPI002005558F|nr:sulfite exporter TauE/SafE family protein [Idiomarina sp. ATCH4]MCK7458735.1 sulfite exporter TauE/SafE family protein [Idiomarina sp. ATCH4]